MSARATALVIEDDDGSREMLALALADHGLAVEVARDGAEGLARLEGPGVDLVVLDFRMPALDGAGFMQALRAQPGPRPPVLLVTAAIHPVELAAGIGADAVLPKPFDLVDLYRAVDALLSDRAPRAREDDR